MTATYERKQWVWLRIHLYDCLPINQDSARLKEITLLTVTAGTCSHFHYLCTICSYLHSGGEGQADMAPSPQVFAVCKAVE